ncbi:MAG: hypothetical protein K2O94_00870 [Clostridiales bacterium]|nr:hypothetical protein [Clostridiales bacterium]
MNALFILSVMFLILFVPCILIAYLAAKRESKYMRIAMLVTGGIGLVATALTIASLCSNV